MRVRAGSFVIGVGALILAGCSGQKIAPVKGRVMFKGEPVKEAAVTFSLNGAADQKETGEAGTGFTDADGYFVLSTLKNYDGAIVGTHTVHVTIDATNPTKCKLSKALTLEVKSGPNEFIIEMDPR